MAYKVIQVGTGGWGRVWCEQFLPPNIEEGLIEVVAAVNRSPEPLKNAQRFLGLRADQCYTDIRRAFDENRADFCTVVVPPAFHEAVVDAALDHGMHILSEKPIADSLTASVRIAQKVKLAGAKMGVTMSHRFDQDKTTLRRELCSARYGQLDYLVCRFTCDSRKFGCSGRFRHEMADPLMIEGAVHHLDTLADLAGGKCDTIYAQTWNPIWGQYAGHSQALVMMRIENGVRALYEGAKTNAIGLNSWTQEYIRAECEWATLVLDHRRLERFTYDPALAWADAREGSGEEVQLLEQPKWGNAWLIEEFVHWLDAGRQMETNVEDNLQSMAMIFAAIESSKTGRPVKVQDYLADVRQAVEAECG